MADDTIERENEWRKRLSPEQYAIVRQGATERAFTGRFWDHHEDGVYSCVCCDAPLFDSRTKFESGSGWPSFFQPLEDDKVEGREDAGHGMVRTEIVCQSCGAHLGHVFPDGPAPTGLRYCINSASLDFERRGGGGD